MVGTGHFQPLSWSLVEKFGSMKEKESAGDQFAQLLRWAAPGMLPSSSDSLGSLCSAAKFMGYSDVQVLLVFESKISLQNTRC